MSSPLPKRLWPVLCAIAMTLLFWWPLYQGAGFIGGDLYPYFFPQKAFYADALKDGHFPLWNDLSGFGYPVLGESQTGAAYPMHLILYRCLDLNTAYNVEHLLHYLICFIATWSFARRIGLTEVGSALAAVVFTYGWFPPRACLEWAILTGAWMPVSLWCVESYLQTRYWRYAIGLAIAIGLQLLAGHYHLAFITDLTLVGYVSFRLWLEGKRDSLTGPEAACRPCREQLAFCLSLTVLAGAGLAAIQLLPTWELKQRSTRVVKGGDYDPAYGQMPPAYMSQAIAPWLWYSPREIQPYHLALDLPMIRDLTEFCAPWHWFGPLSEPRQPDQDFSLDAALHRCAFAAESTGTNKVEAHFYCGLVPIALAFLSLISWMMTRRHPPGATRSIFEQSMGFWLIAGLFALVYATGVLLPIGRHLPGFSFFRGPGRYGIVTTLTVALLAGQSLNHFVSQFTSATARRFLLLVVFASTCSDLWLVSRMVRYTVMVAPPRINFRDESEVRRLLKSEPRMVRMLSPGPNVGNLLDVSCVPWYQGIAPAEYVDPQFAMPPVPKPLPNNAPTPSTPELMEWLSQSGVTHILNFDRLDEESWQVDQIWKGVDPFLNRVWGREEATYLYRFRPNQSGLSFPGRVYYANGSTTGLSIDRQKQSLGVRRVTIEPAEQSSSTLILTELAYEGWKARSGNTPLSSKKIGMFRAVEVPAGSTEITWSYEPTSVRVGAFISLTTVLLLAAIAHFRFWHPKFLNRAIDVILRKEAGNDCSPPVKN